MSTQTVGPVDAPILYGNARRLRLKAPQFRRKVVERKRLLARLGDGRQHRVVRICAPAGFGKTILATQLIRSDPRPSAWIALEHADNDAMVLLRDVVAMLGELDAVRPEIMLELGSPAPRIEDVVLPGLAEQLAGCDPSILVLDDLDQVTHPDSLVTLSFLIEHAPAGSQLVLVSRTESEVPLARLRAAGEVLDLRAADLAFDARETRALLSDGGVVLSDEEVDQIRGRAEGWATGMALAMLSPDGPSIALGRPAIALGGSHEVAAYLLEEAVGGQPAERRAFLFGSSLLRRMSASPCDAALGIENSGRMIAALERDSLFIVALNGDGEWYRYHDLFRELLESEMQRQSPDLVAGILRRAAAWHDERGDTREAFEYAYTSGDLERAGRILLRSGESLIARGQIETVRGWMGRCTREQMGSNPQLALAGAWIALLSGEAAEASRLAAVAETAGDLDVPSADGATSLRSSLANLRATLAADGISQMLRDAEFVVEAERRAGTRWIMDVWRGVATAHLLSGNPGQAIKAFAQVLALTRGRTDLNFITVNCLGYSALAAADAGDWRRARKWARDARAMSAESGLDDVLQSTAAYTALAAVLLHDGLLPQAGKALDHVRRLLSMLHALRWFEADISLRCADMSLDLGDTDAGLDLADIARAALDLYPDPGKLQVRLTALDARLSSGGDLELTPSELRLVPFLPSHLSLQQLPLGAVSAVIRYRGHLQHPYSYGLGSLTQARKWSALAASTGLVDLAGLRGTRAHSALALGLMELARERYVVQEAGGLGLLDRLGAVARAQLLVDAHHMRLDRAAANAEPISDTPQRQYVASRGSTRSSAGVKLTGRWSGCGLPPVAIGCWALLFNLSPPMTGFLDHIG